MNSNLTTSRPTFSLDNFESSVGEWVSSINPSSPAFSELCVLVFILVGCVVFGRQKRKITAYRAAAKRRHIEKHATTVMHHLARTGVRDLRTAWNSRSSRVQMTAVWDDLSISHEFPLSLDPESTALKLELSFLLTKRDQMPEVNAPGQTEGWWTVLGVPQEAGETQIRAAYRELAIKNHPDSGGSVERMAQINVARDDGLRINQG